MLPDAETPQRVDAGGSLGQRGLRLLYRCATPTLQKSQMSDTSIFMEILPYCHVTVGFLPNTAVNSNIV